MESREPQAAGTSHKLLSQRQFPLTTLNLSDINAEIDASKGVGGGGGSLFQYNTTIVDLNPFEKKDARIAYSKSHPNLSVAPASTNGDSRFREENTVMFNKIVNQKKFLINKNIRFYEPVKDAKERHQIMAKFDTLRSKLAGSQTKNYHMAPSPPTVNDKDDYYLVKNGNNNNNNKDLMESFKNLHNQSTHSSEKLNSDNEKVNMFKSLTMSSFEEKYLPIRVINTRKKSNGADITATMKVPSARVLSSSKKQQHTEVQNESRSTHYADLMESKNRTLTPTPQQNLTEKQSTTTNNPSNQNRYEDFSELKRFSRYHTNLTRKSLQAEKFINSNEKKTPQKNSATNAQESNHHGDGNINANISKLDNGLNSNDSGALVLKNSSPLSKKINHVVRKSSKCRLENIYYKPDKSPPKKSNENLSLLSPRIHPPHAVIAANATNFKIDPSTSVNPQVNSNNVLFHKSTQFIEGRESVACNDPSCTQYQTVPSKSASLHNLQSKVKKELPHERFQRIKKAEVQTVQNIIGDIPSTLHVRFYFYWKVLF
jgi:hypothetical protein